MDEGAFFVLVHKARALDDPDEQVRRLEELLADPTIAGLDHLAFVVRWNLAAAYAEGSHWGRVFPLVDRLLAEYDRHWLFEPEYERELLDELNLGREAAHRYEQAAAAASAADD
ncbi:hypothetical protein [Herbihabitans rhizosphaerae]|nr:hypothetical protein [Herbihabitans rhizosphaerae]